MNRIKLFNMRLLGSMIKRESGYEKKRQVFRKQKRKKAPGPDCVTPACLKSCADQLAPIFTQIFNRSLELCEVPSCFKRSTIIPIPKKSKITGLQGLYNLLREKFCILSPLLFSVYTNNCTSTDSSVKLQTFADDTTVIGLIQEGEESAYRQEVEQLAVWCSLNNLEMNTLKTMEMIVDFRRNPPALPPLTIMDSTVAAVKSFRFLGTTISQDLKWDIHIDSIVKKAQQRLYFLRQLRKFNLPQELLKQFYSAIIESVLCTSVTVWFSSASKSDLRRLQRVVRTAERIIGTTLPSIQELYLSRVSKRAGKITLDPSHPAHSLFELLPSGRRYRALSTRTARHRNSFFPPGNPSNKHLIITVEHITLFIFTDTYTYYLTHILSVILNYYFFAHNIPVHT
uniref:Alkylated DNA repair protein AlkB homologue 8 N-terminal domain-containing protein n=1 Tax=Cyprinus carpio TaxID=7962 RepID=A0A8C2G0Q0_CYPCA